VEGLEGFGLQPSDERQTVLDEPRHVVHCL
jgi:hypothetical protein